MICSDHNDVSDMASWNPGAQIHQGINCTMPSNLTDLNVPSIKEVDAVAAPMVVTVTSLIASIAVTDDVPTPRELAAGLSVAETVADSSDDPAVVRSLILLALNLAPKPLDPVLKELASSRANLPEQARPPLLEALFPLLSTSRRGGSSSGAQNGRSSGCQETWMPF
ncbi:MAG: hypothetical protein JOZ05_20215 [Acetobacteraceae bacterium]|nr:hypothetical protein [Acetobacteraceae bacterium]